MSSQEIAPCPFCGNATEGPYERDGLWRIECLYSKCDTNVTSYATSKLRVIAAWNRRATSEREKLVEKVVEAAKIRRDNCADHTPYRGPCSDCGRRDNFEHADIDAIDNALSALKAYDAARGKVKP